tara:strand:+ start:22862 stop:23518 length:657 start_codon:yes stop_codon:yes gene_type:complete
MESKIYTYSSNEVEVTWDQKRCIHAKECVHGSPDVFDITKKPWINPENLSSLTNLKKVIMACPSGALHYKLIDDSELESPESKNSITIQENGPLYVRGNISVIDAEDNELINDTRIAFCRCGASKNKPFCDNSHIEANFESGTDYNPERLEMEPSETDGGDLKVKLIPNGPFVVEGNYEISGETQNTKTAKKMSFCRCGASSNKPFCDGTHRKVEFTS